MGRACLLGCALLPLCIFSLPLPPSTPTDVRMLTVQGVPPVMGAHLMASGTVSPVSVSKGAGVDVTPHQFQYHDKETNTMIQLHANAMAAANGITKLVVESAAAAIKAKDSFTLVLSGKPCGCQPSRAP